MSLLKYLEELNDWIEEYNDELRELYLRDNIPWVLMSSFGKDSVLLTSLVWDMLSSLPKELRTKTVHIVTSNTLVEIPSLVIYVNLNVERLRNAAYEQELPIEVHLAEPRMENRFFRQVLGKGNPPPTASSRFRFCTDKLKIQPTDEIVSWIMNQTFNFTSHDVIMLLGARNEESVNRKKSIKKFTIDESKFSRHAVHKRVLVYLPIKYLSTDDVWTYILQKFKFGWGVEAREIIQLYEGSSGECPITMPDGKQSKSCGSSRFGCWTCGLSGKKDKMLINQIDKGEESLLPLLIWKGLLLDVRNDARYRLPIRRREKRRLEKLREQYERVHFEIEISENITDQWQYELGSITIWARRELLEALLYAQKVSGLYLIQEEEISAILDCWREEGYDLSRDDLEVKSFEHDGALIFNNNGEINKKATQCPNPFFEITITLDEKKVLKLYDRLNTRFEGIFMMMNEDYTLYRFFVCMKSIKSQLDAEMYLKNWLDF
jgi:DNA sulfur modification protein DndC